MNYRRYVREAQNVVEEYGLDDDEQESGHESFGVWYDRQHQRLVLENQSGEKHKFNLTGHVIREVEEFVKSRAIARYGRKALSIVGTNRARRRKDRKENEGH
jgi:hypothetical protein